MSRDYSGHHARILKMLHLRFTPYLVLSVSDTSDKLHLSKQRFFQDEIIKNILQCNDRNTVQTVPFVYKFFSLLFDFPTHYSISDSLSNSLHSEQQSACSHE